MRIKTVLQIDPATDARLRNWARAYRSSPRPLESNTGQICDMLARLHGSPEVIAEMFGRPVIKPDYEDADRLNLIIDSHLFRLDEKRLFVEWYIKNSYRSTAKRRGISMDSVRLQVAVLVMRLKRLLDEVYPQDLH